MTRRKIIIGASLLAIAVDLGLTRYIWLSGFDQGAAVAMCVSASIEHNKGLLAVKELSCKEAEQYRKSNPLWLMRRRGE